MQVPSEAETIPEVPAETGLHLDESSMDTDNELFSNTVESSDYGNFN